MTSCHVQAGDCELLPRVDGSQAPGLTNVTYYHIQEVLQYMNRSSSVLVTYNHQSWSTPLFNVTYNHI